MIPHGSPGQTVDEGPSPSPEELLAMVEYLQQQGMNMDQIPSDLKVMRSASGGCGSTK
jgi:hypothetical protein